ncbi:hypothetical protein MRX96_053549 [Rhipicephalus microplus]
MTMDYVLDILLMPIPLTFRRQAWLVLWRHVWLTRVRHHYVITLLELAGMLLLMSSVWDDSVAPYRARPQKDQFFDSTTATALWGRRNETWTRGALAFAPDQPFYADLVARVCKALGPEWSEFADLFKVLKP